MLVRLLFKTFDLLQLPWVFRLVWPLLTGNSRLTAEELEAEVLVLGPDAVRYSSVRVTGKSWLETVKTAGVSTITTASSKGRSPKAITMTC